MRMQVALVRAGIASFVTLVIFEFVATMAGIAVAFFFLVFFCIWGDPQDEQARCKTEHETAIEKHKGEDAR